MRIYDLFSDEGKKAAEDFYKIVKLRLALLNVVGFIFCLGMVIIVINPKISSNVFIIGFVLSILFLFLSRREDKMSERFEEIITENKIKFEVKDANKMDYKDVSVGVFKDLTTGKYELFVDKEPWAGTVIIQDSPGASILLFDVTNKLDKLISRYVTVNVIAINKELADELDEKYGL